MTGDTNRSRTSVVTLGTCGGPKWREQRSGISTAIVVDDQWYVVDFGYGAGRQLHLAGCDLSRLRAGFVSHLHSDHTSDLANLLLYGWYQGLADVNQPVELFGPSGRGAVPSAPTLSAEPEIVEPADPMPGFAETMRRLVVAYSADVNDRMRDNARPHPDRVLHAQDIPLDPQLGASPENACPPMDPQLVYHDELVRVFAILVEHSPMWPSYAFRFETPDGSVVISGDTGPCENMRTISQGADMLVHEVIDEEWIESSYADRPTSERDAMVHHHLTAHTSVPELGRLATAADVGTLVLTHFVPGDLPDSRWRRISSHFDGSIVIASDLDRLVLSRRTS